MHRCGGVWILDYLFTCMYDVGLLFCGLRLLGAY